ncbi:aldose 1-epimerase [Paenibacillus sp. FSL R7-0331]|uniref:aldose 1-epimerase n=1 Tax=Paenibacillus sp. FSL R7-0331 TaxID=1536773 RepID=UPI0004F78A62|nr:aldose 1-epimerase [Paenibacillus sp. FSL R7-0331]AIQ54695.1 galactose mutarotase [Paenibacillus sp. FSL R7-0331]
MKQVTKGQWGGYDTYILHSRELEVTLLPRLGNNVISLWDRKEERQILRTPDESDLAYYMQKPYHFGIPLLVPPGRIRKGQFRFGGASYQFEQNSAGDHHIHGLHRTQSWCVSDIEEDEDGCAVTTEFNTADDPGWMAQFPVPLRMEMTFRLQDARLQQTLKVTHLGDTTIPFGIGYHTWFMIDGEPQRWKLTLPAEAIYELNDELLTSGNLSPLGELDSLHHGMDLAGKDLDTVLRTGGYQPSEALLMREDGYGIRYTADRSRFRHWVIYTKGLTDQYLCAEPYTWLPDAPNLNRDADFTGIITLNPGDSLSLPSTLEIIYPKL